MPSLPGQLPEILGPMQSFRRSEPQFGFQMPPACGLNFRTGVAIGSGLRDLGS